MSSEEVEKAKYLFELYRKLKEQYKDLELLGSGMYAKVYKAKKNDNLVALRQQKRPFFLNDIEFLELLKEKQWKNCALPKEVFVHQQFLYAEYELFMGDCSDFQNKQPTREFLEKFIVDVGNGLQSIHYDKYIHIDLKPANIVYKCENNNYQFSICDLGSLLKEEETKQQQCCGTPFYMPYEMSDQKQMRQYGCTRAVDVWAFGVTLFELITSRHLFEDDKINEKGNQYFINQQIQSIPDEFYQILLTKLLQVDYKKRPTIKEFLNFFQEQRQENRNHGGPTENVFRTQAIKQEKIQLETLLEYFKSHDYEYYMNQESDYPDYDHIHGEQYCVESSYPCPN